MRVSLGLALGLALWGQVASAAPPGVEALRATATDRARAERVVFLGRNLSAEETIAVTGTVAASGHPGVVLFETPASKEHTATFLRAFGPSVVLPIEPAGPGADPKGLSPAQLQDTLFPTAKRIVVVRAASRRLLLHAACLAGALRAPLLLCQGRADDLTHLQRAVAHWQTREIFAVGDTYRLCRDLADVHTLRLLDEQAVAAASIRHLRKQGPIRALVLANPADCQGHPGSMSSLAPWIATQKRGALLLTNEQGKNVEALVHKALQNEELLRADVLLLVGDLHAIPMERRPNPIPDSKDEYIEMEPLTPTGTAPFSFATGRLFHDDPNVVALVLARERLLQRAAGTARKALLVSNPGGGLPLLETFSRNTAAEFRNAGYQTSAFFGEQAKRDEVHRLLPEQDVFLWEGHHSTLIRDYGVHQWPEPLRPALIFLQSCLALTEAKAQPFLERGAVGVIGSSTRTWSGSGGPLAMAFFDALLYDDQSLGGSLRQAKNFMLAFAQLKEKRLGNDTKFGGVNVRTAWAFTLWGDPTLKLPRPATPPEALPRASHQVRGRTIVVSLPGEKHGKVVSAKYYADVGPNIRLAGLRTRDEEEDGHRLIPFVFAEVYLPHVPAGKTPHLQSRLPDNCWVFCWDQRRSCGYLLVRPRADAEEIHFHVSWRQGVRRSPDAAAPALPHVFGGREALMSRLTLCVVTAAVLAALALGILFIRQQVMGEETAAPAGPGTYHVTMLVRGKSTGEVKLLTACPLDFHRQHVFNEDYASEELNHRPLESKRPDRREAQWAQPGAPPGGAFEVRYQFYCRMNVPHPTASMTQLSQQLYAPPREGEYTGSEQHIEASAPAISDLALEQTVNVTRPVDQARVLFRYVSQEIGSEPGAGGPGLGAVECLKAGRGDAAAKSRLLAALCRNRGIPTRLVTGLMLGQRNQQQAHVWVETWVDGHWMPFCPFNQHCGRLPPTYLIFGFGETPLVHGHNLRNLTYACLVEHKPLPQQEAEEPSLLRRLFEQLSLTTLPPTETGLVEFLLLLPVAALIICIYRNLIGLHSFGTFAPALIGLAFRRVESLPGLLIFVSIVLIGWGLRRVLDRYRLLQVPRTAFLLSLVVLVLLTAILAANFYHLSPTRYISLFPMVILTGMIERFWTLETEDGTFSSFRTLLGTMVIAGTISFVAGRREVVSQMFRFPETLGLLMAGQLLIGRYTGYRLAELFRFRDFVRTPQKPIVQHERIAVKIADFQRLGPHEPR